MSNVSYEYKKQVFNPFDKKLTIDENIINNGIITAEDMNRLEDGIWNAHELLKTHRDDIHKITQNIDSHEKRIKSNEDTLKTHNDNIATLARGVKANLDEINAVKKTVGENSSAISSMSKTVSEHANAIKNAQQDIGQHTLDIKDANDLIESNARAIEDLQDDKLDKKFSKEFYGKLVGVSSTGIAVPVEVPGLPTLDENGMLEFGQFMIPEVDEDGVLIS